MTSEEKKSRQTATDKDLPETEEDLKPEQECEESGEANRKGTRRRGFEHEVHASDGGLPELQAQN